jgi:hypothetical protein
MSGNRYIRLGLLATHPAFNMSEGMLACPLCKDYLTHSAPEYDKHFLAHEPTQEQAYKWLSGKTYRKVAQRKDWPDTDQLIREGKL